MGSVLTEIVVDAADPAGLAAFWSEVLGWEEGESYDGVVELAGPGRAGPKLIFVPADDPKAGKNRLHLDVNPKGCDQDAELDRLLGLGAVEVDVGQGEQTWIVLADPEGNEFCLLGGRVD